MPGLALSSTALLQLAGPFAAHQDSNPESSFNRRGPHCSPIWSGTRAAFAAGVSLPPPSSWESPELRFPSDSECGGPAHGQTARVLPGGALSFPEDRSAFRRRPDGPIQAAATTSAESHTAKPTRLPRDGASLPFQLPVPAGRQRAPLRASQRDRAARLGEDPTRRAEPSKGEWDDRRPLPIRSIRP